MLLETWLTIFAASTGTTAVMIAYTLRVTKQLRNRPKYEEGYTRTSGPRV